MLSGQSVSIQLLEYKDVQILQVWHNLSLWTVRVQRYTHKYMSDTIYEQNNVVPTLMLNVASTLEEKEDKEEEEERERERGEEGGGKKEEEEKKERE